MSEIYQADGAQLSYIQTGEGLPVVFLHPTPFDHDYWRPVIDELKKALPVLKAVVPDLRGHGASELGDLPAGAFALMPDAPVLSMAQLAADVRGLLAQLEISEAVFVGCSIGGYMLLELWRQIPGAMRGVAFVCSKPQADTPQAQENRARNIARARSEGVAGIFDGMTQSLIGASARQQRPAIVAELRARMTLDTDAFTAVQAGLATRPDSLPTVADIRVPVLAICGGEDSGITAAEMEVFRAAPGGCDFHLLAEAGHLAAYEYPERVAGILGGWLGRVGR
jgi:pimeloyl-ACP methyl ester carboxylesterase